jgi:hypothetical protein
MAKITVRLQVDVTVDDHYDWYNEFGTGDGSPEQVADDVFTYFEAANQNCRETTIDDDVKIVVKRLPAKRNRRGE